MQRITMIGLPRPCGGAFTERGHTILLWRKMGWDVRVLATLPETKPNPWIDRLKAAGCEVVSDVEAVHSLKDELCVSFCCQLAVARWSMLHARGCRLVWSPCMNDALRIETKAFPLCKPTAVHFQSKYQASRLAARYPESRHFVIPGAFDVADFPFSPAVRDKQFVVGKLSRAMRTKWPADLWDVLGETRAKGREDLRALCMAWDDTLTFRLGKPPDWATALEQDAITSREFMGRCHALYCAGQTDTENWPRVGLEAMASGVPIVADNRGGWLEMLDPDSGFLVSDSKGGMAALRELSSNELRRRAMVEAARARVERLADPSLLGKAWETALNSL